MKTIIIKFQSVLLICIFAFISYAYTQQNEFQTIGEKNYVFTNNKWHLHEANSEKYFPICDNTITLKFTEGTSQKTINDFEKSNGITFLRKSLSNWYDYKLSENEDIFDKYKDLVEFDNVSQIEIPTYGEYIATPNDNSFNSQWYLDQVSNADINAPQAWNITTGDSHIIVGILDSGTDWTHEDLGMGNDGYQNIYLNYGEDSWSNSNDPTTGNGMDDDLNGYIDDWKGYDFDGNDNDSRGPYFHGTHVAGLVAAKSNNTTGIAGLAGGWNNEGVKMLVCGVGNYSPNGSIIDDAIDYAAEMGAKVIQLSLTVGQSTAIDNAIQNANDNYGVLVVCASGNGSPLNVVSYPASHNLAFAVGATDQNDTRASYSKHAENLDMAAPGDNILSTQIGDTYGNSSGTSFAAPLVSSCASLLLSVNNSLTNGQVKDLLRYKADKVGGYNYNWNSLMPGHSKELGYGRLNCSECVQTAALMYSPDEVDLYTRDYDGDFGVEPSDAPQGTRMWCSPDIWVRNQPDGIQNQQHQNPEYSSTNPVYVYVRVKNKGELTSTWGEYVLLHWAKAGTNLTWPTNWDGSTSNPCMGDIISGQSIPPLVTGQETILEFKWYAPNPEDYQAINPEPWHFCLLSRIQGALDPMTYPEGSSVNQNTFNNNNIAWKNLTIVDNYAGFSGGVIAIGNIYDEQPMVAELNFNVPQPYFGNTIIKEADVILTLDEYIFEKWLEGGKQGENIEEVGEYQIQITGDQATLGNLVFNPHEWGTLDIDFHFFDKVGTSEKTEFNYMVTQTQVYPETEIIGGEQYTIRKTGEDTYKATSGADNNSVKYDETEVNVKQHEITKINPNPTSDRVTVEYNINNAKSAHLQILRPFSSLSDKFKLELSQNRITIDVSRYKTGHYIIQLVCDDHIVDAKSIIVK